MTNTTSLRASLGISSSTGSRGREPQTAGPQALLFPYGLVPQGIAVHALKGSLGLFGQGAVCDGVQRLEQMGRSGDLTGVDETCATLERAAAELCGALGDLRATLES